MQSRACAGYAELKNCNNLNIIEMKKVVILLAAALCAAVQSASAWGRVGHEAIAAIAENHLTERAKANIEKYLDGRSIVYYAAWMDQQHDHKPYKHTVTVDKDNEPLSPKKRPELDGMNAISLSLERLQDYENQPKDTVAQDIKFIVHLIGDIHCPAHIVYPKVTRFFPVTIMGRVKKYHPVWDGMLDYNHGWGYNEWREQLDRYSEEEIAAMAEGTPMSWARENAQRCRVIYEWAKKDDVLDRKFINQAYPLAEDLVVKASYRLAKLLNELFDE